MVLASNPRLMNRVVDAVINLREGKGSTARDILELLRKTSKISQRNLTMQVHRALKHAVNAGLLRHRSGRYKALFTLNPTSVNKPTANHEKNDEKSLSFQQTPTKFHSDDSEDDKEKERKRRVRKKRKKTPDRKRRGRSGSRTSKPDSNKLKNNNLKGDNAERISKYNKRRRNKAKDSFFYDSCSDFSDCDDPNAKVRKTSLSRREKSSSKTVSLQRKSSQQLQSFNAKNQEETKNIKDDDPKDNRSDEEHN